MGKFLDRVKAKKQNEKETKRYEDNSEYLASLRFPRIKKQLEVEMKLSHDAPKHRDISPNFIDRLRQGAKVPRYSNDLIPDISFHVMPPLYPVFKPSKSDLHGDLLTTPKSLKGRAWKFEKSTYTWTHPTNSSYSLSLSLQEILDVRNEKRPHVRDVILKCFYAAPDFEKGDINDMKINCGWDPEYY